MLTTVPTVRGEVKVRVDVTSVVVRLALRYVMDEQGWSTCAHPRVACTCLVVSDRPPAPADRRVDVLVSRDDPAACQCALDAVLSGAVRSVLLWDEPEALVTTVEAIRLGSAVIPTRVIDLALEAPRLTERQRRTVHLIAAGRSNPEIAAALHQSTSTTKRDLAELMELLDVSNRASLAAVANRLGFI